MVQLQLSDTPILAGIKRHPLIIAVHTPFPCINIRKIPVKQLIRSRRVTGAIGSNNHSIIRVAHKLSNLSFHYNSYSASREVHILHRRCRDGQPLGRFIFRHLQHAFLQGGFLAGIADQRPGHLLTGPRLRRRASDYSGKRSAAALFYLLLRRANCHASNLNYQFQLPHSSLQCNPELLYLVCAAVSAFHRSPGRIQRCLKDLIAGYRVQLFLICSLKLVAKFRQPLGVAHEPQRCICIS